MPILSEKFRIAISMAKLIFPKMNCFVRFSLNIYIYIKSLPMLYNKNVI